MSSETETIEPKRSYSQRISCWLSWQLDRWRVPGQLVLLVTSLLVGLGSGVGAVVFRYLIRGVEWMGYEWFPRLTAAWGNAYVVLVPTVGGALVGYLVYFYAREAKGHGVPEVMEAVALRGGRIRPRVAIVKSLASSLCIGSGGSVGREGPIVQIGSALGSTVGQFLRFSENRIRMLVACGAAGGIAATFNAPVAGVLFGLEIILGKITVQSFSSVVVAAVAASVVGQAVFGDMPAFTVSTEYGVASLWEFAFYPLLGVLAALVGVLFVRTLYWAEDMFEAWKGFPEWLKPAVGGGLLGLLGLAYPVVTGMSWEQMPQVFNVGYGVIESALNNELALKAAVILLVLKLVATGLTLGSGGSGGVFAPSLFMGAMLGSAYEMILQQIFPGVVGPEGAYALLGMAAVFAASAHAPITAILILFELTGDYRLILPLMLTVVIATLLARFLLKNESIYTLKLSRRGVRLREGWDVDIMNAVKVSDVMTAQPVTVDVNLDAGVLPDLFLQTNNHAFPVVDEEELLVGVVSLSDYRRARQRDPSLCDLTAGDLATYALVTVYPDESVKVALDRMAPRDLSRLPVVSRENPRKLLGIIRRNDIVKAYRLGTVRATSPVEGTPSPVMDTVEVQLVVPVSTLLAGKSLATIHLPGKFFVLGVQRGEEHIPPRGSMLMQSGDILTVLTRERDLGELDAWWRQASRPHEDVSG